MKNDHKLLIEVLAFVRKLLCDLPSARISTPSPIRFSTTNYGQDIRLQLSHRSLRSEIERDDVSGIGFYEIPGLRVQYEEAVPASIPGRPTQGDPGKFTKFQDAYFWSIVGCPQNTRHDARRRRAVNFPSRTKSPCQNQLRPLS